MVQVCSQNKQRLIYDFCVAWAKIYNVDIQNLSIEENQFGRPNTLNVVNPGYINKISLRYTEHGTDTAWSNSIKTLKN